MFALLLVWFGLSLPLTFLGSFVGLRQDVTQHT